MSVFWLTILGIWLLINVLFVVLMMPPNRRRPVKPIGRPAPALAGRKSDSVNSRYDDEPHASVGLMISSFLMGAFFLLVPVITYAVDLVRGTKKNLPPSDADQA